MAYDRMEPFGEGREDYRAGIVASTVANANRGRKTLAFTPDQFVPTFGDPEDNAKEEPTPEELHQKIATLRALFGDLRDVPNGDTSNPSNETRSRR
jgi:hypothetical protein